MAAIKTTNQNDNSILRTNKNSDRAKQDREFTNAIREIMGLDPYRENKSNKE